MTHISFGNHLAQHTQINLATTEDGFLKNMDQWSTSWAQALALEQGYQWTATLEAQVIATREFYFAYAHSPKTRVLIEHLKQTLDSSITSVALQITFKENPALALCRLAGLPRPKQCF